MDVGILFDYLKEENMGNLSSLSEFCDLVKIIAKRDNKTCGQVIDEIVQSLEEKDHSLKNQSIENGINKKFTNSIPHEDGD